MPKNAPKRLIVLMVIIALVMLPLFTILTACEPTTTNKTSPSATATLKPTPTPVPAGAYKGVVLMGDWHITLMQAKGFSSVHNRDGKIEGGIGTRNFWGNEKFIDHVDQASEEETCKYFTVPLKGTELDCSVPENMAKYNAFVENGDIPMLWSSNDWNSFSVWALPEDTTKVMIGDWLDEKVYEDLARTETGVDAVWTQKLIDKELKNVANAVKNRFPDVELFVCGVLPPSVDWGHLDAAKYPNSPNAGKTEADLDTNLKSYTVASVKECNATLKKFADEVKATFIDVAATDLVNADGKVKAEFTHSYGDGRVLNNAGIQIYGDTIMAAMGLKKPSEANPDWFKDAK